jgi:predicted transporter
MPLAFVIVGILFLVAAVRGKQYSDELLTTVKSDFTGPGNFFYWGIALFVIGAVGYYKPLRSASNAFLTLVVVVLFFSNRGFFQSFMDQISATQTVGSASDLSPTDLANVNTDLSKVFNADNFLSSVLKQIPFGGGS